MMDMDTLRRYWTDPRLHPDEAFLRDYMLNEGWKDKGAGRWVGTVGVACRWNYGYIVSMLMMFVDDTCRPVIDLFNPPFGCRLSVLKILGWCTFAGRCWCVFTFCF